MRAAVLAALVLALAGCGGSAVHTGGTLDNAAAQLVPPNAIAYVSADSRFDSARWRTIFDLTGAPKWIAAQLVSERGAARLELRTSAPTGASTYRPTLLRHVPSGAIASVSFKDLDAPLAKLPALKNYIPASLLPALRGEGVAYLAPATIVPTFVFAVQSPDPGAAEQPLRATAKTLDQRLNGALKLRVARYGSRVVLTNAPANAPSSGGALVDDQPFKDALAAAGAPAEVTFLAYADVQRLTPFL